MTDIIKNEKSVYSLSEKKKRVLKPNSKVINEYVIIKYN